jgi:hypothetical protein
MKRVVCQLYINVFAKRAENDLGTFSQPSTFEEVLKLQINHRRDKQTAFLDGLTSGIGEEFQTTFK